MMEYDEIRITTRREIDICEEKIHRLEKIIASMEMKYKRSSEEFFSEIVNSSHPEKEISFWQESILALERWKERLAAHQEIMRN